MKKLLKFLFILCGGGFGLLAVLFVIYFFNLDMKLTVNIIAPLLGKVYDRRKRKQYV